MSEQEIDVIVIGAGAVGENVADRVAQAGLSVVIVESDLVGGECSYWACMPSKVLLRPGAAARAAGTTGPLDVKAILQKRDEIASHWKDDGQVAWLDSAGIGLVRGHARLDGVRRVQVVGADGQTTTLVAKHAVALCTGSSAFVPDIPGLEAAQPWTSREATSADHVPSRLAIVGGGVVAMEMATAFQDLGSRVTVLARDGVLTGNEPFAGEFVTAALTSRGAEVREGVQAVAVSREGNGSVVLELSDGGRLEADEVLVATGRVPNSHDVGLETVGLPPGEWLATDDTLQVQGAEGGWLYAVGDLNHRALLTHQGKYQARAAGDAIAARALGQPVEQRPWQRHVATADHAAVPQVTFTDPEVASVGLTAAKAQADLARVRVVDYDLGAVAGAVVHADGYTGRARFVIDEDRKVLVGATFVGPDVAELLHAATVAIVGEVPLQRLWHAVPAYPTISEVWLRLLESYGRASSAE
jgi:pyruvate/2-oxoglutarate dehydrogenase complex dihydrolipoamide dehydrogenase (E3) component